MKKLFILFSLTFISCIGQTKEDMKTVTITKQDTVVNNAGKADVPKDAYQMNLGFVDKPVWVWVKYDHKLHLDGITYDHIYGINYWDEDGLLYTMYYEQDREGDTVEIDFSNYIIEFYPGDGTIQLIGKNADTILLFSVLEDKRFRRNFKGTDFRRYPTVNYNKNGEKVSDAEVEFSFVLKSERLYEVTIIDHNGINKHDFKSNCDLDDDFEISYYDLTNGKIYLISKDCYLSLAH